MLMFPNAEVTTPILTSSSLSNAEVLEAVLAWTVAGLSDEHIVKMFSSQDIAGHKPNAGLKAYSVYLIASSNLCLLLVSELCDKLLSRWIILMNDACAIETHKKKITVNILYDIKN